MAGRGIVASYPTLAQWVREGRFQGAERDETERGPVWRIPVVSVKRFEPPKSGRPAKARANGAAPSADGRVVVKPKRAAKKGGKK